MLGIVLISAPEFGILLWMLGKAPFLQSRLVFPELRQVRFHQPLALLAFRVLGFGFGGWCLGFGVWGLGVGV